MKKHKQAPPENRIDNLANRLQEEGKIADLEAELLKIDPASLAGVEKESWHHLHGIVCFQAGDRARAFERFQEGLRQCPDSAVLSFALGQEYEFKGDIENMIAHFDQAKFPGITARYALAKARYAYLWNRNDKGLAYVEPLIAVYFQLKILDSTFLYIRGMPFFNQTWDYVAAFYYLLGDIAGLKTLTTRAAAACSDFDFDKLRVKLEGLETGDYSRFIEQVKTSIAEGTQNGLPVGYLSLQYQILAALSDEDPVAAERALESVSFAENDFPWLEDMRLLAKCELAHRAKNEARESELQSQFFRRQPLLFEPDNALNFNLLAYQENLKARYQKTIKAGA